MIGLAMAMVLLGAACSKKSNDVTLEPPPTPVEVKQISLSDLKKLSTGASVKVPDNSKITGTVISDAGKKNIAATTVVLQDAASGTGLVVNFASAPATAVGDQVEINISGQTLAQVNGEVVLQGIVADSLKKTGTGTITPKTTNAKELAGHAADWDGTLVTLPAGMFSGSGKYSGTLQYADSTGTVASLVQAGAAFENTAYPVAVNSLTGIVRVNGTGVQVNLRDVTDAPAQEGYFLVEDFSGADVGYYTSFAGSLNFMFVGAANYPHQLITDAVAVHTGSYSYINLGLPQTAPITSALWNTLRSFALPYYGAADASDAGFTNAARKYLTVLPVRNDAANAGNDGLGLSFEFGTYGKELKSITVVFAGSKLTPAYQDLISSGYVTSVAPNSSGPISYVAGLLPATAGQNSDNFFDVSETFHDVGAWHTVKFENVIDKFMAAGGNSTTSATGMIFFGAPQKTDYARGTMTNSREASYSIGTPIVIDKIILEFSQKPEWW